MEKVIIVISVADLQRFIAVRVHWLSSKRFYGPKRHHAAQHCHAFPEWSMLERARVEGCEVSTEDVSRIGTSGRKISNMPMSSRSENSISTLSAVILADDLRGLSESEALTLRHVALSRGKENGRSKST
jgi:hypothetical protein